MQVGGTSTKAPPDLKIKM